MAGFLLFGAAVASTLTVDAKLPTEVLLDGRKVAEVWEPARVMVDVPPGEHLVRIYRQGNPTDLRLTFSPGQTIDVVVGRTGITSNLPADDPDDAAPEPPAEVTIELRAIDATQIRVGQERLVLGDGQDRSLGLPVGTHPVEFRNPAGTVIWARGDLVVEPGARVVVQVSSGRLPEVSGSGRFDPGSP